MRSLEPRSILLPPDYEEQQRAARRARRRRLFRSPLFRTVLGVFVVVAVVARPVPVQGSFQSLLVQTIEYVSILVDEFEKHSRVLEEHLDRATGMMQPFSDIHAGVTELMDTRGLMRTMRMVDSYRSSVANPECYRSFPPPAGCELQADFTPPEARSVLYTARRGFHDATDPMTLFELEEYAFTPSGLFKGMTDALRFSGNAELAADIADTDARIAANRKRARWNVRRARSVQHRAGHASRLHLYKGETGPDGCPITPIALTDAEGNEVDVAPDTTIFDQVIAADCLSSSANVGSPTESQAHLSEAEAGTLQTASLIGMADMVALDLEGIALQQGARIEGQARADARRRDRLAATMRRLSCLDGPNPTIAYSDGSGDCNVDGAVADVAARLAAVSAVAADVCFWPPSVCFAP